ncbi:hypothetical protein [Streptomyces roseolus]|uniref:hypothetical protein n=1 Tax=Streptomyces roseolus TaxID=67358 RepID=UPI0016776CBB|nr:hypothetical protein [Streptomyces roseolus]GGR15149.1 hypothetical protein GCM10010282_04270 [Streptomyces roseolus]
MQGKRRAVSAALTVVLALGAAGCGAPDAAASAASGREAVQTEIRTVVADAGLPESATTVPGETTRSASPSASPSTDRERVARRMADCTAGWQYIGPAVTGSRAAYDAALGALAGRGWVESGKRIEEKIDKRGGVMTGATFRKRGWTLAARHAAPETLKMDSVSLVATEDVCMEGFTEEELDLLGGLGDGTG